MEIQNNFRFKSGIYFIKCKSNNRLYIGSSVNIYNRLHQHLHRFKNNKHFKIMQNSVNKYGLENFECGVVEYCEKENLLEREQYYIDTLKPYFNTNKNINRPYTRKFTNKEKEEIRKVVKEAFYSKNHFYFIVQKQKRPVKVTNVITKKEMIFESRAECIRYFNAKLGLTEKMIRTSIKTGKIRNNLYFEYIK